MKWAVGITTVPERQLRGGYYERCLESIHNSGFGYINTFCDWGKTLGPHGNFVVGLTKLFHLNRFADRYAMFQDDCIAVRNLREYLESHEMREKEWWNLLTHPQNERIAKKGAVPAGHYGWFKSNQKGMGAVGLVFPREAVITLLSTRHLIDFACDPANPRRYPRYIDGAIATALTAEGWTEYCHYPSLLEHIGRDRAVKNKPNWWPERHAMSFPGEDAVL